jgi:hypothetical protein
MKYEDWQVTGVVDNTDVVQTVRAAGDLNAIMKFKQENPGYNFDYYKVRLIRGGGDHHIIVEEEEL